MDDSDGIEGLSLEKVAVAGRDLEGDAAAPSAPAPGDGGRTRGRKGGRKGKSATALLLGGVPYHHYISAQCSKEHRAVQVRSGGGVGMRDL